MLEFILQHWELTRAHSWPLLSFVSAAAHGRRAMRTSLQVVLMGFTVAFTFLSFTQIAAAEPKDEVEAVAAAWAQALGEDDPDKVLPLYSSDAVLWGTLSPKLRSDPTALRDYF